MECKICKKNNEVHFQQTILNKYTIKYYHCSYCGFLQTEEPYWINEAYDESINVTDTGIMFRNIYLSKVTTLIIYSFFNRNKKFLDFAGGYGVLTRLMRDIGFDFYWMDKFSKNLHARGFEFNQKNVIELITSFEAFEHFVDPLLEIEKILAISRNVLFSTDLIDDVPPDPDKWWYYGLEHGQHISFYSLNTIDYIAKKYKLNYYTNGKTIHLLTEKKLNNFWFKLILKLRRLGMYSIVKLLLEPKMDSDMKTIISESEKK